MSVIADALKKIEKEREPKPFDEQGLIKIREQAAPLKSVRSVNKKYFTAPIIASSLIFALLALILILSARFFLPAGASKDIDLPEPLEVQSPEPVEEAPTVSPIGIESASDIPQVSDTVTVVRPVEEKTDINDPSYILSNLKLNGIMYSTNNPYAVIDDNLLAEGDFYGNIQVVRIEERTVSVELDGVKRTLRLNR